jgi:integrase
MTGKGNTAKHADLSRNRVARLLHLARSRRVSDLTLSRVQAALKDVRDEGASLRSVHHYMRAIKAFSRWLRRDGRAREDAVADLTCPNPDPDRRHVRRALSAPELTRLIESTAAGPPFRGIAGASRAWLYKLAAASGLRAAELASLTPESFDLAGDVPTVRVAAAYSKSRRDDIQPIPSALAAALAPWLALQAPGTPLWRVKPQDAARMIRRDLDAAGVPYRDECGRVADFHALRVCYITSLALSNAPVKVVQSLARHSNPTLTLNCYARVGLYDQSAALDALPDLTAAAPDPETTALAPTGTDPITVPRKERAAPAQRAGGGSERLGTDTCAVGDMSPCSDGAPSVNRNALENGLPADSGASVRTVSAERGGFWLGADASPVPLIGSQQ